MKNVSYPGSEITNFKACIKTVTSLLRDVDRDHFFSPYSVVPVISQIMGLNTPLMGSGDSPYSITSVIFSISKHKELFRKMFNFPLREKRLIIDEIYEMIAPLLLGEEDEYIDLLISVKYKKELRGYSRRKINDFKRNVKEKFSLLSPFIYRYLRRNGDFGYIVHYGYAHDLHREFDFLTKLSPSDVRQWRRRSYPIVNEIFAKNFPSPKGVKKEVRGWVIFVANYTEELLFDSKLRKKKIPQAALLAKKLGAKIIGMGGLIASFAQGGYELSRMFPEIGFTTGHAYTIGNIVEIAKNAAQQVGVDIRKSTVAVVGAAGSIGSGCAKLLAEEHPEKVILIDLSTFNAQRKLNELSNYIRGISPVTGVQVSSSLTDLKGADLVVVATNSPTSIIKSTYLKSGAIVIDDSFPKNVPQSILDKRKDIILLEGGMMRLPLSIDVFWARNMPDLMDLPLTRVISCKETYGCFAEILVLSLYRQRKNYGLGYADVKLAKDILRKAKRIGFSGAPLQCFDEAVEEERIERVRRVVAGR